jgi:hypothetical protein
MVRTQVQLTEEQALYVRRTAAERGVSVAAVIRESIERCAHQGPRPNDKELRRRARLAAGCLRGGPKDIATNHDEYAAEAYEQ